MLGFLTLARFGPSLLGSPLAGVLVDRFSRRSLVLATQTASLVQAAALATLTLAGTIQVWHVLALAFVQGVVDTVDMPARQTLQVDLVGVEDLQSAVSLNSTAFNVGRMVGPALAGVLIAALGRGVVLRRERRELPRGARGPPCGAAARRRAGAAPVGSRGARRGSALRLGRAVRRAILAGIAVTSAVGLSYTTVLPVLARDVLHAGRARYGMLLAGAGLGAVVGSLLVAARRERPGRRGDPARPGGAGVRLVGLGLARSLAGRGVMVVLGLVVAVQMSTTNGFLQTTAPPRLRGRVVALYTWLFAGLAPVGGLPGGLPGGAGRHHVDGGRGRGVLPGRRGCAAAGIATPRRPLRL